MIVSESDDTSVFVVRTGSRLAGAYRIMAAMSSAQVRWIACSCRQCSRSPQRGQWPGASRDAGRASSPHSWHEITPAAAALCGSKLTG